MAANQSIGYQSPPWLGEGVYVTDRMRPDRFCGVVVSTPKDRFLTVEWPSGQTTCYMDDYAINHLRPYWLQCGDTMRGLFIIRLNLDLHEVEYKLFPYGPDAPTPTTIHVDMLEVARRWAFAYAHAYENYS